MKFAWIENNQIRDVAWTDPNVIYHPDIAKFYDTQVPDNAENGDGWVNGQLIKPEPFVPNIPAIRLWSKDDVRNNLSLTEKVKWDNDTTPEIKTVKAELNELKNLNEINELLNLLVSSGAISQESANKILL